MSTAISYYLNLIVVDQQVLHVYAGTVKSILKDTPI